ncbi:hypothetical protein [Kitasatospora cinereorecta]
MLNGTPCKADPDPDPTGTTHHEPYDPADRPAGARHSTTPDVCANEDCWTSTFAPVVTEVPLATGEIGENTCSHGFADRVKQRFDDRGPPTADGPGTPGTAPQARP